MRQTGGAKARFARLYSNGNTANRFNHHIEVDVHGSPGRCAGQARRGGHGGTHPIAEFMCVAFDRATPRVAH